MILMTNEAEIRFQTSFNNTLNELREVLHRHAKLSSRNEALEELGKLIFVQIVSIKNNLPSIESLNTAPSAEKSSRLLEFTAERMKQFLPNELISELELNDFMLRLKPNEFKLAEEIICSFSLTDWKALDAVSHVDVFNEIFGRFLNDSFAQEKELGQYLTPSEMVTFIVENAISTLSDKQLDKLIDPDNCKNFGYILDPSCGVGSFLTELVRQLTPKVINKFGQKELGKWLENVSEYVLVGIDKSERMIKLAISNLAVSGLEKASLHSLNSLERSDKNSILTKLEDKVQLILTNPPFGAEFSGIALKDFNISTVWCSKPPSKIDSEILFMERYLDWLGEGGICVTVIPDSILTNKGLFADLRNGIRDKIQLNSVVSFPTETFAAAGTTAKTSVINFSKSKSYHTSECYFANCENIGFKVVKQGAHKKKVSLDNSQLPALTNEIAKKVTPDIGQFINFDTAYARWDATYHSYLPQDLITKLSDEESNNVYLSKICQIVNDRINPSKSKGFFNYIEISDIDSASCSVSSKQVKCHEAPSRARKRVKVGDILASTVRPEQGKVGVVLDYSDDNAICTTGFIVLRSSNINPLLIARLLQTKFVIRQLMRHNVGVAYPTVEESAFYNLVLPISESDLLAESKKFDELVELERKVKSKRQEFKSKIRNLSVDWEDAF